MHVGIEPNSAQFVIMLIGRNILNDLNILLFFVFFSSILLSVQFQPMRKLPTNFFYCVFLCLLDQISS